MFIFLTTYKNDFEKRKERYIFAPVFSMSKLPQKHVANQWVKSWDMLEAKNIKFYISAW